MELSLTADELRPLVQKVIGEVLACLGESDLGGRISYTEPEAAAVLGIRQHVLRDARLRGEVVASRVGKKNIYTRTELMRFLDRNRI